MVATSTVVRGPEDGATRLAATAGVANIAARRGVDVGVHEGIVVLDVRRGTRRREHMKEVGTLILGGLGALLAIFLKEAVQQALQRRVLAWQLFGYLLAWKSNIVRTSTMLGIYMKVEERDKKLTASMADGTAAFEAQWKQHRAEGEETRNGIREAVQQAMAKDKDFQLDEATATLLEHGLAALTQRQNWLVDSKSFVSDKDAAMLGRSVALNVIQFRTSMVDAVAALQAIVLLAKSTTDHRASAIANMIDEVVVHGETALVAFIRLERQVARISKQSVAKVVWDILVAK